MAVTAAKTFVAGEILTASDLNALNTNILSNGEDLAWPATKAKDFDGQSLTLDADGDSSIAADTDDQIDFAVGGSDVASITSTGMTIKESKVVTRSSLVGSGLPMLLARVATLEARVSEAENYALLVNHASSF